MQSFAHISTNSPTANLLGHKGHQGPRPNDVQSGGHEGHEEKNRQVPSFYWTEFNLWESRARCCSRRLRSLSVLWPLEARAFRNNNDLPPSNKLCVLCARPNDVSRAGSFVFIVSLSSSSPSANFFETRHRHSPTESFKNPSNITFFPCGRLPPHWIWRHTQ